MGDTEMTFDRIDEWLWNHRPVVAKIQVAGHILMFIWFGLWPGLAAMALGFGWLICARLQQLEDEEAGTDQ